MVGAEVVMTKVEVEAVEVVSVEVTKAEIMVDMVRFLHLQALDVVVESYFAGGLFKNKFWAGIVEG